MYIVDDTELHDGSGQRSVGALPVPPGVDTGMSQGLADMLARIPAELSIDPLKGMPVAVPWGTQEGIEFQEEEQPPRAVFKLFPWDDRANGAAVALLGGQGLPYLAVLSPRLRTSEEVATGLAGTPYELERIQAVRGPSDERIRFLYWLSLRDVADREGGNGSLPRAAAEVMEGTLVLPMTIPTPESVQAPPVPLQMAWMEQFSGSVEDVDMTADVPPAQPGDPPGTIRQRSTFEVAAPWVAGVVLLGVAAWAFTSAYEQRGS